MSSSCSRCLRTIATTVAPTNASIVSVLDQATAPRPAQRGDGRALDDARREQPEPPPDRLEPFTDRVVGASVAHELEQLPEVAGFVDQLIHDRGDPQHDQDDAGCACRTYEGAAPCRPRPGVPTHPARVERHDDDGADDDRGDGPDVRHVGLDEERRHAGEDRQCPEVRAGEGPRQQEHEGERQDRDPRVPRVERDRARGREVSDDHDTGPDRECSATATERDEHETQRCREVDDDRPDSQRRIAAPEQPVGHGQPVQVQRAGMVPPEARVRADEHRVVADGPHAELEQRRIEARERWIVRCRDPPHDANEEGNRDRHDRDREQTVPPQPLARGVPRRPGPRHPSQAPRSTGDARRPGSVGSAIARSGRHRRPRRARGPRRAPRPRSPLPSTCLRDRAAG